MRDRLVADAELLNERHLSLSRRVEILRTKVESGAYDSLAAHPSYPEIRLKAWVNRYSAGADLEELERQLSDIPKVFSENQSRFFEPAELGTPLRRLLTVASLVALFEHREGAERVAEIVEAKGVTDFLIDSFIGSLVPFREPSNEIQMDIVERFQGSKARSLYEGLREAADFSFAGEHALAAGRLTKYVSGEWFVRHKAAFSWSTTNLKAYAGYWCFEGAAVAKVFDINDAALQGHKYYPDDLVRIKS